MTTSKSVGNTPVIVVMSLKKHLTELEATEYTKPPLERRRVPSLPELAKVAGITKQGIYTFASEHNERINMKTLSIVISELRRQGFPTDVSDLLIAYPANSVKSE